MAHQASLFLNWTRSQFGGLGHFPQFHREIWFSSWQVGHHQHAASEAARFCSLWWSDAALRWRAFASLLRCER
eukprot:9597686-Alexandrium_andersonii.AAC.1